MGFQSIGVTKDWRPPQGTPQGPPHRTFPINRRHQGLATGAELLKPLSIGYGRFQSIGVTKDWRQGEHHAPCAPPESSFQSIGVTKDWRRNLAPLLLIAR